MADVVFIWVWTKEYGVGGLGGEGEAEAGGVCEPSSDPSLAALDEAQKLPEARAPPSKRCSSLAD